MWRAIVLGFTVVEILFPDQIIAWGERRAFENPNDGELRTWTMPMARLEGVLFAWLALGGRRRTPTVAGLLAVLGVPALLAPERFVRTALKLAYRNPDDLELKPWVVPATRAIGLCYVVLGTVAGRVSAPAEDSRSKSNARPE
ncbi:hypothetical protein [Natronosalvus caseinilyticus]|uniref:hypothetical protein n=1 Tax=Natronosalvus caseinilyticus TaxID=2953747 RepID=UPI0028A582A9|nr:hypothetical protein [Natronosalvus caseinilyticus]